MKFSDLEYVLMIFGAVMCWRVSAVSRVAERAERRASMYADFMIEVGQGKGTITKSEDGVWIFERNESN